MPRLKYRNPVTGEYEALDVEGKVPKELSDQVEKNKKEVGELKADTAQKQDAISDLAAIRSGAAKGATALQSVTGQMVSDALGYKPANDNDLQLIESVTLSTNTSRFERMYTAGYRRVVVKAYAPTSLTKLYLKFGDTAGFTGSDASGIFLTAESRIENGHASVEYAFHPNVEIAGNSLKPYSAWNDTSIKSVIIVGSGTSMPAGTVINIYAC